MNTGKGKSLVIIEHLVINYYPLKIEGARLKRAPTIKIFYGFQIINGLWVSKSTAIKLTAYLRPLSDQVSDFLQERISCCDYPCIGLESSLRNYHLGKFFRKVDIRLFQSSGLKSCTGFFA